MAEEQEEAGGQPALEACGSGSMLDLPGLDPGAGGWPGLKDDRGATAVHYAARSGSLEVLQWLVLEQKCPGNTRSRVGATPALDAAATGKQEALVWLFQYGGCEFKDEDDSGATALHLAARYGHLVTVKWLEVNFEADLSMTTKAGATPLHFAASKGDLDIVKFLVERNSAVIDRQMETGATSSYLAAQEGHLESLRYLVEEGGAKLTVTSFDGMSCLHAAAQMGRLGCVAWMVVTDKIGINECDFDGASALHFSAGRGHVRVVEWLLAAGARIIQDNIGGSPLHDAAEHGKVKCVRALLRFGCDAGLKDNNGMTAADLAENCWHRECAATLRRRLAKGLSGMLINAPKRPSIRNYFSNDDDMDMSGAFRGSDHEGINSGTSDYVHFDSGSETSSTYVVHTDYSRSSARSSDDELYSQYIARFHSGSVQFPRFSIPPPPSWPPPPVPTASPAPAENADVTSQQSTTSSQSETEGYENLQPGELASIMQMKNAIKNGSGAWLGGMPIYGVGATTEHDQQNSDGSGGIYGVHMPISMNGYGNSLYGSNIQMTRNHQIGMPDGLTSPSHGILPPRMVLKRYQPVSPVNQEEGSGPSFSRVTMSPRLKEILERDSEVGSRQTSIDVLETSASTNGITNGSNAPPTDLPIANTPDETTPIAPRLATKTVSAPCTPAHSAPPPPPLPPPDTFTPPTNSLRWKKMAFGSLPNVSMAGDAARFLLRPVVTDTNTKKGPNIDLIAELKAANGKASLKRVRRQNEVDETESLIGGTDSEAEPEPKAFWKQLQKRSASPTPREAVSRRNSVVLRKEFQPQNFLYKVEEKDVLGLPVPGWKRLIVARQLAEKAQAADDEIKKVEEEQNKYKDVPAWKRALIQKKEREAKERQEKNKKDTLENEKLTNGGKEMKIPPTVSLKKPPGKAKGDIRDQQDSIETENKLNLKKILTRLEDLSNTNKTEKTTMAPWQLELRKKRDIFKDGFV